MDNIRRSIDFSMLTIDQIRDLAATACDVVAATSRGRFQRQTADVS
ncbi:hypothetical protein ACV22V_21440 [Burkholderia sp. AW33-5]